MKVRQTRLACDRDPHAIGLVGEERSIPILKKEFPEIKSIIRQDITALTNNGSYLNIEVKTKKDYYKGIYTGYDFWQFNKHYKKYKKTGDDIIIFMQKINGGKIVDARWQWVSILYELMEKEEHLPLLRMPDGTYRIISWNIGYFNEVKLDE